MIARDEVFLDPVRREEGGAFGVVGAAGEKLQGQERMSRSAFAQIDLDRISLPRFVFVRTRDNEVEREPANHGKMQPI